MLRSGALVGGGSKGESDEGVGQADAETLSASVVPTRLVRGLDVDAGVAMGHPESGPSGSAARTMFRPTG
jgi:hypothetical protein